uniref:chitinase CLP-like n=1 Tax=Erigeron canadensis TaxID=72917 RepID=UPI001CB8F9DA|nr:chitinase CLP-like [Erigeron canadensis]
MHLPVIKVLVFLAVCFSHDHVIKSQSTDFNTSVIPILKDATTSLPKISWSFRFPQWDGSLFYLIDLDAPFTWKNCVIRHIPVVCGLEEGCRFPLPCDNILCKEAQSYLNPTCPSTKNITSKYSCRICAATPFNPISKTCKISQLTTDLVTIYTTNGRNPSEFPRYPFGTEFVLSCAPNSLLKSFPQNVSGIASFSWSSLGFPRQVYNRNQAAKFALCLPGSSSSTGVTFLGDGPFHFTSLPNVDLRSILSYTPMIRKNSKSLGYYIKVNRILIKGTSIITKSISVKLSTVVPYTILRSDIYKSLTSSFSKAVKNIPSVTAVKPFSLCLKASAVGSVPSIDFETESGKIWTISKDNLMKNSGNGASCLAFVDGGSSVKDAVVIGTFQMENNFLFFDLVNQKLGFSSSLIPRGTSCSGFNFTVTP